MSEEEEVNVLEALHTAAEEQNFNVIYVADAEAVSDGDIIPDMSKSIIIQHDGSVICLPKESHWTKEKSDSC